jgi:hypothetical protein
MLVAVRLVLLWVVCWLVLVLESREMLPLRLPGTYGFNAGIEFDIDALERQLQAQQTQSIASNLIANNININTNKTILV